MTISACIIARDEERRLPDCLASVAFCDQVVVVDSGSIDATLDVARAAGATVVEHPWRGFGTQRNVAIDNATGDWILEVDADERVSDALRAEIQAFVAAAPPGVELAGLPIRDRFLGRSLGPSAKYPKYRHRLFRRGSYRHDESRTVHEGLVPRDAVHPFAGDLDHLYAETWGEAVADSWAYARLEAGQLDAPRTAGAVLRGAVVRPAAKLAYRLVVDGGWRDGWRGAAKIGLECAGDTVVWLRHASGRSGDVRGRSGVAASQHFGSWQHRLGTPRLVGVAGGAEAAGRAAAWLAGARAAGADVVLVSDAAGDPGVRVHHVAHLRPLALIRALSAEDQLRAYDALVAFGPRAGRLVGAALPPALRGAVAPVDQATPPDAAVSALLSSRDAERVVA